MGTISLKLSNDPIGVEMNADVERDDDDSRRSMGSAPVSVSRLSRIFV